MILSFPFVAASFDADARAYINTSGATDRAAINHFVKGMKRLGLYSSMVCWPLRSSQNAGTGSTAYSLGGLGTYNGTLINGPTWGADGVTKTGANQVTRVTGTDSNLRGCLSIFTCFKSSVQTDNQRPFTCEDGTSAGNYWQINLNNTAKQAFVFTSRVSGDNTTTIVDPTGRETAFNYFGSAFANTTAQGFFNGTPTITKTGLAARNPTGTANVEMLGVQGADAARGTGAFAVAFVPTLTDSQMTSVYLLYKSTLGQGLGLP